MSNGEETSRGRGSIERALRVGAAIHNAGHSHAAHDAWEEVWLDLPEGDDERLLHGLIQYTAAIHHARNRNWAGATGLAGSAREYLAELPSDYGGVALGPVLEVLSALKRDPEWIERTSPPRLVHQGEALSLSGLGVEECLEAAPILAAAEGYRRGPVERGCEYAREAVASGESNVFLALCVDFVREPARRGLVHERLAEHVERRRARERDVEGLFDPGS